MSPFSTNLIIILMIVMIVHVDNRHGGRARSGRVRLIGNSAKNKLHSYPSHHSGSLTRKSNRYTLAGGGAALVVGSFALRSYMLNHRQDARQLLLNGSGHLCVNRENFSNFVFNEFRCPLLPVFSVNHRYCCGSMDHQYCCSFWESGGRAILAIIGIISACSLFLLFIICGIVYYRRYLHRKGMTTNSLQREQMVASKPSAKHSSSDSPPPYSEAIRNLT